MTSVGAVYREEGERRVPVGVVGFQFDLAALKRMFSKTTINVGSMGCFSGLYNYALFFAVWKPTMPFHL